MKGSDTFDLVAFLFWTGYSLLIVMVLTQMVAWLIF